MLRASTLATSRRLLTRVHLQQATSLTSRTHGYAAFTTTTTSSSSSSSTNSSKAQATVASAGTVASWRSVLASTETAVLDQLSRWFNKDNNNNDSSGFEQYTPKKDARKQADGQDIPDVEFTPPRTTKKVEQQQPEEEEQQPNKESSETTTSTTTKGKGNGKKGKDQGDNPEDALSDQLKQLEQHFEQHFSKLSKGDTSPLKDFFSQDPDAGKPKKDLGQQKKDENQKSNGGNNKKKNNNKTPRFDENPLWQVLTLGLALLLFTSNTDSTAPKEISFQEFKTQLLAEKKCASLRVNNVEKCVYVTLVGGKTEKYYFTVGSMTAFEKQLDDAQYDLGYDPSEYVSIRYNNSESRGATLLKYAPLIVMTGILLYSMRNMAGRFGGGSGGSGGGIFNMGKAKFGTIKPDEGTGVTFKDVAGLTEAKVEIMEFVEFLKNAERFERLGAKMPKGALLVGPPGTGKTLLAKATAGEASVPFYSISGSDFIEMFVGVGASRVRDLFKTARENAPCIVFIDEIDAVGRKRSDQKVGGGGGNDERESTLNQLLVEMDGFKTQDGVVVLAGTNRIDILDKALLRPGRFDRTITVDKPDIGGRVQIFKVHLSKILTKLDNHEVATRLAALTPGFAGADIANICNEAALVAAREDADFVLLKHFEQAVDRVIGGLEKRNSAMTLDEKKLVAYHEAGHAVAGWFLEHADPLLKVTIVPRGNGALGFAQYLPKELSLYQTDQLSDMMCMALGGRAAEQIFFQKISTGASDDLQKVTNIAYSKVAVYGMSETMPNIAFERQSNENQFQKAFSEKTAEKIDAEVASDIADAYARTLKLLTDKQPLVDALAKKLLELETINHDVIVGVLGPRPFVNDSYVTFLENQAKPDEAALDEAAAAAAEAEADTETVDAEDSDASEADDIEASAAAAEVEDTTTTTTTTTTDKK